MTVVVHPAGVDRVPELAALIASAFADDPIITWPFEREETQERARRMFLVVDAALAEAGMLWEARPLLGAAAWVGPADSERFLEIEAGTRSAIAELTHDGGERYAALWDWIEGHLPPEPCWYLDHIAVDEAERGRGIGSALMRHGLELAARDGVPAVLETARPGNLSIYEHLGFRTYVDDDVPGGGPHVWFMRAEP